MFTFGDPSLATDRAGNVYYTSITFTPTFHVGLQINKSTDHGDTWSPALKVSGPATPTTVMPWVAARGGKVDVVYYGSAAASVDDRSAVWNTYDSQLKGGTWSVKLVSNTPNRFGPVCLNGSACAANRELLDLFEVAEDPANGKAAVIYSDTTTATWTGSDGMVHQLPEIVLAYEK